MNGFKQTLDRILAAAVTLAMAGAVLTVLWQVVSRYLLGDPSSFTDELARYLLIWIGLLGAAQAAGQKMHLAIDLLPNRLTPGPRHRLAAGVQILIGLFSFLVMGLGGWFLVRLTFTLGQSSAALGISLAWIYAVIPLSGLIMTFYAAFFARQHLRTSRIALDEGAG